MGSHQVMGCVVRQKKREGEGEEGGRDREREGGREQMLKYWYN